MERSIGNTFKDSRYLIASCLFCIYIRIYIQIDVFCNKSADIVDHLLPIEETLRSHFMPVITRFIYVRMRKERYFYL